MLLKGYLRAVGKESPHRPAQLTAREKKISQLLAEGNSTKEAASVLHMSTKTAETHRSNIMRKLDIHSVSGLVLYAIKNNIIQMPGTS